MSNSTLTFLEALWPDGVEDGSRLLLWTLPDKISRWYASMEEAAAEARELRETHDVYVGVGVGPQASAKLRLKRKDVTGIPGFVADLDLADEGRPQKPNAWRSMDEIGAFIETLPRQPTLVVHSGGGVHLWWLFHEPWVFESKAEWKRAGELSKGWSSCFQALAQRQGRQIDSMWDLARVMRLPGTWNRKLKTSRPVKLLRKDGPRYNPSDFEEWSSKVSEEMPAAPSVSGLVLDPNASVDPEKFSVLIEIEPHFLLSWKRARKGLKDDSPSAYDLSLATFAAQAGWSAQEIADLIIASRKKHGDDLKLRPDYYERTIAKAMEGQPPELVSLEGDPEREELLSNVRALTGVPVARILLHGDQYLLVLEEGRQVVIGDVTKVMSFAAWNKVAFAHGTLLETPTKGKAWTEALQCIRLLVEEEDSEETSEVEYFRSLLRSVLQHCVVFDEAGGEDWVDYVYRSMPFQRDGKYWWVLGELRKDLRITQRWDASQGDLVRLCKQLGAEKERIFVSLAGSTVARRYWFVQVEAIQ